MGKQVCAKHNEAYETECKWCEPFACGEIPVWTGEIKRAHPWKIKQAPVAVDAGELQRLMNEAWVKMARLEKDAKAAAFPEPPTLTVECYPGCPLCRKEKP